MISLLNVTLTFAEEPAKAAVVSPSLNIEKAERIKKLQNLTLEQLQQVRIIPQTPDKPNPSIAVVKNANCSSKNLDDSCK